MFRGLSAFPLTPFVNDEVDEAAFIGLVSRLAMAGVNSIAVLGSTGSYAYLRDKERARIAHLAVEHSAGILVIIGIGALRTSDVLAHVASIKIPPVTGELEQVRARIGEIRAIVPDTVTIGISGDASATTALLAGCDAWYSVLGGTFPNEALSIVRAVQAGKAETAIAESARLLPLWKLFGEHGSYRVIAALAEHLNIVRGPSTPRPVLGLNDDQRGALAEVAVALRLSA